MPSNDYREIIMTMPIEEDPEDTSVSKSSTGYTNCEGKKCVLGTHDFRICTTQQLCPCCNLPVGATGHQIVGVTPKKPSSRHESTSLLRDNLTSLFVTENEDDGDDLDERPDRMMPGVLGEGIAYTIREVIAQGYVHKKGSGYDWLGSTAWKARWAVLVRARVDGHGIDVPLLQIFWTSNSPTASTVISLDSAVVIPEDNMDHSKSNFNPYRFKIRHVKKSVGDPESSFQLTRVFSCPKEGRDDWVYVINRALLDYEKEKANASRLTRQLALSPVRRSAGSRFWSTNDVSPISLHQRKNLQRPPSISLSSRF